MVRTFRKKPVTINAIEWTGKNLFEVITFIDGEEPYLNHDAAFARWEDYCHLVDVSGLYIRTMEGDMKAYVGDFIIQGVHGEFYPCKTDIFWKTYEEVNDGWCP